MQCPNCEAENRDSARFCDECGFPLGMKSAKAAHPAAQHAETAWETDSSHEVDQALSASDDEPELYSEEVLDSSPEMSFVEDDVFASYRDDVSEDARDAEPYPAWEPYDVEPHPPWEPNRETRSAPEAEAALHPSRPGAPESRPSLDPDPFRPYDSGPFRPYDPDPYRSYAHETRPLREERDYTREMRRPNDPIDANLPHTGVEGERRSPAGEPPFDDDDRFAGFEQPTAPATTGFTMEMPRLDEERPQQGRDFRMNSSVERGGNGKRIAIIAAGIVVGAALALLVTFALGLWGGKPVPDVKGMTEADATRILNEEGFEVRSAQVKSDDTEGLVLITDPESGSRAAEGSEVVIHIATTRFVPDIVGKAKDEAQAALDEAGYDNIRFETERSDDEENIVMSVSPDSGTRAKSNTEIVVKVSEAYRVPSVSDLDINAAMSAISEAGLNPEVVYIDTDQFIDGTIIGTTPEAETKVSEGEYVTISVARARGVELVALTESLLAQGSTCTIGGVDYEVESLVSASYQGNDTVAFTITGRPKITFFGETLYASFSQTVSGMVAWSDDNEVVSIS